MNGDCSEDVWQSINTFAAIFFVGTVGWDRHSLQTEQFVARNVAVSENARGVVHSGEGRIFYAFSASLCQNEGSGNFNISKFLARIFLTKINAACCPCRCGNLPRCGIKMAKVGGRKTFLKGRFYNLWGSFSFLKDSCAWLSGSYKIKKRPFKGRFYFVVQSYKIFCRNPNVKKIGGGRTGRVALNFVTRGDNFSGNPERWFSSFYGKCRNRIKAVFR